MKKPYVLNKLNSKYDIPVDSINRKVYVFYHIYCGSNDWEGIVSEQVQFLRDSKLTDVLTKVYISVGCVGGGSVPRILSYFENIDVEVIYQSPDGSGFEFPCMQKMQELAAKEKFYALYFHTKGSSYSRSRFVGPRQSFDFKQIQCVRWRNLMNYFTIYKWNLGINALQDGYDAYGILHRQSPKEHFSGNFWWATSECIADTQPLTPEFMADRYNAEFLILNNRCGLPTKRIYAPFVRGLLAFVEKNDADYCMLPWWHYRNLLYLLVGKFLAR